MVGATSNLTAKQRYAAGALFAIALNQAQINQTQPLGIPAEVEEDEECDNRRSEERRSNCSSGDSFSDEASGYTKRRIFSDPFSATSSPAKHHIDAFTRLLSEEASDASIEMMEQEMALAKAADAMVYSIQSSVPIDAKKEKHQEYAVPELEDSSVFMQQTIGPSVLHFELVKKTMVESTSNLTSEQRYVAGALFAIALNQAQINQTQPLGVPVAVEDDEECEKSNCSSGDSVSDDPGLWVHETMGLLQPVFSCLDIKSTGWPGLEKTTNYSPVNHYISEFMRLLSEEASDNKMMEQEIAIAKAADAMVHSIRSSVPIDTKKEKHQEYKNECREKYAVPEVKSKDRDVDKDKESADTAETESLEAVVVIRDGSHKPEVVEDDKSVEEVTLPSYERRINVLYELLCACLSDKHQDVKKYARSRVGYDARHRVALRVLATWFNIEWIKVEALETIVACSTLALQKSGDMKDEDAPSSTSTLAKWKHVGIIGAVALTGGTLTAFSSGVLAPVFAAWLGTLAPTLGTIVPVIGASGFAAAASAAGTVTGSVVVAASFGVAGAGLTGFKMARITGDLEEFEFKAIGENHKQGRLAVEVLVSGVVHKEEDFVTPWEGLTTSLERYTLQWESKILISLSTFVKDWLTSALKDELMKQGVKLIGLAPLALLFETLDKTSGATDLINNRWNIAIDRSDKAGRLLAEVLQRGFQGNRPVTLVGFSLGARVIFKCLQTLAETEKNAGLVERVVLLGAPISIKEEKWQDVRKMVAGRFVNVYATNDWTLAVAFRASLLTHQGLAGMEPIDIPGIENVNVTNMVEGHSSYISETQEIVERLEIDKYYAVFRDTL